MDDRRRREGTREDSESPGEKYIREQRLKAEAFATLELARLPTPPNYLSAVSHLRSVSRDLEKWLRLGGKAEDYLVLLGDSESSLEAREAHLVRLATRLKGERMRL